VCQTLERFWDLVESGHHETKTPAIISCSARLKAIRVVVNATR